MRFNKISKFVAIGSFTLLASACSTEAGDFNKTEAVALNQKANNLMINGDFDPLRTLFTEDSQGFIDQTIKASEMMNKMFKGAKPTTKTLNEDEYNFINEGSIAAICSNGTGEFGGMRNKPVRYKKINDSWLIQEGMPTKEFEDLLVKCSSINS